MMARRIIPGRCLKNLYDFLNMAKISQEPLFSVLVANYNNGRYLEECLDSIFNQTYKNWEIIIVDDGSTDNSRDVYKKYQGEPRIKVYFNKSNRGCGFTKRKCVKLSTGEICGFVDPDDALEKDALKVMATSHLNSPDSSIIYSTHYICNEDLEPRKVADYVGQIPSEKPSWTIKIPVISQFATFKRKKYLLTKGVWPYFEKAVDKDLYFKLEETGPVVFVNKALYYYRHHPGNISLNSNVNIAMQYELLAKTMALFRREKRENYLNLMPVSLFKLADGVLFVSFSAFNEKKYIKGINTWFIGLRLFPIYVLKRTIKTLLRREK